MSTATRRPVRDEDLSVASELALAALTIGAVVGFGRLFENGRYFGPVLAAAVGSHLVAWAARRIGLGLPAAALLSAVAGAVVLVWVIEPSTTTYGVPRGASWHAVADDLRDAWQRFGDVVAPTPSTTGFVAAAVIGTWAAAFLADAAAFRLHATFEAVVPSLTLFVFSSALGPDRHRVRYTIAYLAGLLVFVLVRTATRRAETTSWFAGRRGGGASTIAQGGLGIAAAGVVVAALVGPALPGADSAPLVRWRSRNGSDGPRNRVTVSPLVDIRSRLVENAETELFTVKVDGAPRYWRLTALEEFDGAIWKSSNSYRKAEGPLPRGEPSNAREETLQQEFNIKELASIWLPAAVQPEELKGHRGARYDEESGSLISSTANTNGLSYTVRSKIPLFSATGLARVQETMPDHIRNRYLDLPEGFPRDVIDEAKRVTASAPTPYRKARALQDYFRSPPFTYSLQVLLGSDEEAIQTFLFDTQTGFCQQFAGTYAAMARAVNLPARVAVGFVPGTQGPDGDYLVRGRDAHAWPEVYLAGYGWVAFEPTPAAGRGLPGGEAYAGTLPYQPQTNDPASTPTSGPATTVAPAANDPSNRNLEDLDVGGGASSASSGPRPWWRNPLAILIVLAGLAAAGLGAVPVVRALRLRRRRAAAVTPRARVLEAWEEAEEVLRVAAGLPRRPAETPVEYATRVADTATLDRGLMAELAHATSAAGFSASEVDDGTAARTEAAVAGVRRTLLDRATRVQRVRWAVDPRNLR